MLEIGSWRLEIRSNLQPRTSNFRFPIQRLTFHRVARIIPARCKMVVQLAPHKTQIHYPESDGKPMGETEIHILQLVDLLVTLRAFFRNDPNVYVGGDMLMHFVEGDPTRFVVPDIFVVKGVPKRPARRTFKIWAEGKAPDVVIELTSAGTRREDTQRKHALYAKLGVREYFIFDPLGEYLKPALHGYRLSGESYAPLADAPLKSEILGLELRVEDQHLHLFDPARGEYLPSPDELQAQIEQADLMRRAAETRAARAEAELARVRAELERLRGGG